MLLTDRPTMIGISKYFSNHFETFAIINAQNLKTFYKKQDWANFKKIWFFKNVLNVSNTQPDLEYLQNFEKKFNVNLRLIASTERRFIPEYNPFTIFSKQEIDSLLEQSCRFFENILEYSKPSYLILQMGTGFYHTLLVEMCKSLKIRVLTLQVHKLSNLAYIASDIDHDLLEKKFKEFSSPKLYDFNELPKKLEQLKEKKIEYVFEQKVPFSDKINSFLKFLSKDFSEFNHIYYNYGITKFKLLTTNSKKYNLLVKKYRENFLKHFHKKIHDENFVYFPLHVQPERTTLLGAPFINDQLELISNISKSLPSNYILYVKEHPAMVVYNWRNLNFYKKISSLPNTKLIYTSVDSKEIIKKAKLVITITGSASLESLFYGVPSIIFSDIVSPCPSSVTRINEIESLPQKIKNALKTRVDSKEISKYYYFLQEQLIHLPLDEIMNDFRSTFPYKGFMDNSDFEPNGVTQFLKKHEHNFDLLALEFNKKIQEAKSYHD